MPCWDFSGGTAYGDIALDQAYTTGAYTIACWIKYAAHPAAFVGPFGIGANAVGDPTASFSFRTTTTADAHSTYAMDDSDQVGGRTVTDADGTYDGKWVPWVGTWQDNTLEACRINTYSNALTGDRSTYYISNVDVISIGRNMAGQAWNKKLAHVAVWKAVLSQADIESFMGGGITTETGNSPLGINAANLIAYYKLDENSTTIVDSAGVQSNITMSANRYDGTDGPTITPPPVDVTLNLRSLSGSAARASLTGLHWSWFDAVPTTAAAINYGLTEITDGSGDITVSVNTTLSSGQYGYLLLEDTSNNYIGAYRVQVP